MLANDPNAVFDAGMLVRATGDAIALQPSQIVEMAQIEAMFAQIAGLLKAIA